MSNRNEISIVLGSKRYATATDTNLMLPITLPNKVREVDEFDRNVGVNLAQVFDDERQSSSIIRISSNIDFIFFNSYVGTTGNNGYSPFTNNLYYFNAESSLGTTSWSGFPQYSEFDMIRTDNNVLGYTLPSNTNPPHVSFVNKSASTYNWTQYVTYPFQNNFDKILQYDLSLNSSLVWRAGDGIPFYIVNPVSFNGRDLISFVCPVEHNLSEGEYVEIEFDYGWSGYNGSKIFQVDSIGNNGYNSEKYVFNLINYSFTGNPFSNGSKGTFKRIIDINNIVETKSIYYVRRHKVLTNVDEAVLVKCAFENNIFGLKRQYEFSSLTPDNVARISIKEGSQSYNLTFTKDIDISKIYDNLNRPITELFITVLNRGYFGWFNSPIIGNRALREGYDFNLAFFVPPFWSFLNSSINLSNIGTNFFSKGGFNFYSNQNLKEGDEINGDYCEFNRFEQSERVISKYLHKLHYNQSLFDIQPQNLFNPDGYYYQPHHSVKIKVYSDYIEEETLENIDNVPNYAFYSEYSNKLIWRDLYTYGYIDNGGNGVNYPFLNGVHYPYTKIIFRLIPEGNVVLNINTIQDPVIDNCE